MMTGTIKFFNGEYGFVIPDFGGTDIFFHISRCVAGLDSLEAGDRVEFEERPGKQSGKFVAANVRLLSQTAGNCPQTE